MSGQALDFSNWGGPYATQGIMAPGNEIPSAACDGTIVSRSGTSFATAIVSGVAALLVSLQILQGTLSFALALVAWTAHPSHVLIVIIVFVGYLSYSRKDLARSAPGESAR